MQRLKNHIICETLIYDLFPGRLLDVWLDKMPLVSQPDRKKLLSLALCSLLPSGASAVLDRMLSVVANVVEALNDVTRTDEETGNIVEGVEVELEKVRHWAM